MVCSDQTHIDPAEYFAPDAYLPQRTLVSQYLYPVLCPIAAVTAVALQRLFKRVPLIGGLPMYAMAAAAGLPVGLFYDNFLEKKCMERDAEIYHYIKSHPEDFPPIERVKYKDVLEEWVPVRHGE